MAKCLDMLEFIVAQEVLNVTKEEKAKNNSFEINLNFKKFCQHLKIDLFFFCRGYAMCIIHFKKYITLKKKTNYNL